MIFCFGVGIWYDKDQLDVMVIDLDVIYVIIGDFDDLDQIFLKIKKMVCDGK